ncbi:MAG: redox-sensing transcriptional repressor Rex [Bacteroidetes bacterium]|nr:redox-sensing transcriptional repressor Rex [Bacteroidota bacterium]
MKTSKKQKTPAPILRRLSIYHHLLRTLKAEGIEKISSTKLAEMLEYTPILVRKDLEVTGLIGKPKTGYSVNELLEAISKFVGWSQEWRAVLVGTGNLGSALLKYPWLIEHGLRFVAAFDNHPSRSNIVINNIPVYSMDFFSTFMDEHRVEIGVVAVPASSTQKVVDLLVEKGVQGIWNFSSTQPKVPEGVIVENAVFTLSLASLTRRLLERKIGE